MFIGRRGNVHWILLVLIRLIAEGGLESKAPPGQFILPLCIEHQTRDDAFKDVKGGEAKGTERGQKAGV